MSTIDGTFNLMSTDTRLTQYGFDWGPVKVERCFSDDKKGWVTLLLKTKKHPHGIQIYITKTGKVRVFGDGEWLPWKAKE
ncbi:MAG: hypothetical protein GXY83_15600 [Rhodopirellula sp.]|nr:hypothetical protein [Rhodopirellula sp.]